ncbi:hypothetical protein SUDANB1_05658 [Streptomyces sp. enrichment culture]|uniref:hypothetical protein n=1 Tax=Streptomyces sp. enrichment culture TaxID=1795815 RepID=UPI003F5439F6
MSGDVVRSLSAEDRAEYDELLYRAGYTGDGRARPSHEIKDRLDVLLKKAVADGKTWAAYVLDEDARAGHLDRFKRWDKARRPMQARVGERVVRQRSSIALKRRGPGGTFYQPTLWLDMAEADLADVEHKAAHSERGQRDLKLTARRLRTLLRETGADTPRAALEHLGVTLEEYLLGQQAA